LSAIARDFAILVHLMISDFVVISINCGNYVTSGKKPKTYGRFLGTIFAESFLKRKGLRDNGLRMEKGRKSGKERDTGDFGKVEKAEFLLSNANHHKQQCAWWKINGRFLGLTPTVLQGATITGATALRAARNEPGG